MVAQNRAVDMIVVVTTAHQEIGLQDVDDTLWTEYCHRSKHCRRYRYRIALTLRHVLSRWLLLQFPSNMDAIGQRSQMSRPLH